MYSLEKPQKNTNYFQTIIVEKIAIQIKQNLFTLDAYSSGIFMNNHYQKKIKYFAELAFAENIKTCEVCVFYYFIEFISLV